MPRSSNKMSTLCRRQRLMSGRVRRLTCSFKTLYLFTLKVSYCLHSRRRLKTLRNLLSCTAAAWQVSSLSFACRFQRNSYVWSAMSNDVYWHNVGTSLCSYERLIWNREQAKNIVFIYSFFFFFTTITVESSAIQLVSIPGRLCSGAQWPN